MRIFIILIIIAGIIAALYFAVMTAVAKVSLQISFKNVDLKGISIDSLFNGNSSVQVGINAKLVNQNGFAIGLKDFHIWIYYGGVLMAQSSDTNLNKVVMPAMGSIDVTHQVTLYLNSQILQMLKDLHAGKELKFDYTSQFKVDVDVPVVNLISYPYTYKDYFTYKF